MAIRPVGNPTPGKLAVAPPGDAFEQEAERIAHSILRFPDAPGPSTGRFAAGHGEFGQPPLAEAVTPLVPGFAVPRGCAHCGESVQRAYAAGGPVAPVLESRVSEMRGKGAPLPAGVRDFMEPRFGVDFSQVRVHTGGEAVRMSAAMGAHAFTQGRDIFFGPGRAPRADALTAHELAHVVQQTGTGPAFGASAVIQMMRACPPTLSRDQETPPGWQSYHGNAAVFHCGFRGILEDRIPTPDDPQNECFYDHSGVLVDQNHPFAGCAGTPNQYDSADSPISHTLRDSGGILYAGAPAFVTSRVYDVATAVNQAVEVVSSAGQVVRSLAQGFADAVAMGVLTGLAMAEPGNWAFLGLPARSVRHLNMMGVILTSRGLAGDVDTILRNLTRRLGSFDIEGLLDDIAADVNQAQDARGPGAPRVLPAQLAELSMVQLIEFLRTQGLLQYVRPPEQIAAERLAAERASATP